MDHQGPARQLQNQLSSEYSATEATPKPETKEATIDLTKLDELALKDVERRAEGLVQLIMHNDRKGGQFAFAFMTLLIAIGGSTHIYGKNLPPFALLAALSAMVLLVAGSVLAIRAQSTVKMYTTGRLPEFWDWSRRHDITPKQAVDEHLKSSQEAIDHNEEINKRSSRLLKHAGRCGTAAFACVGIGSVANVLLACFVSGVSLWSRGANCSAFF
jgi:hypothetical protein